MYILYIFCRTRSHCYVRSRLLGGVTCCPRLCPSSCGLHPFQAQVGQQVKEHFDKCGVLQVVQDGGLRFEDSGSDTDDSGLGGLAL